MAPVNPVRVILSTPLTRTMTESFLRIDSSTRRASGVASSLTSSSVVVFRPLVKEASRSDLTASGTLPVTPTVTCWGTGNAQREFLFADDFARACRFLLENYSDEQFINIGYGSDVTIQQLAETVQRVVGFDGQIVWDTTKPDGTPRKLMDSSRLFALGWRPQVDLETGIRHAYADFLKHHNVSRVSTS